LQIRGVDKEIYQAVRAQGGAHTRARQELEAAQQQILELFDRVKEIQRKAEESETMVQEICKDIRKLDYAKKHLTNAITALRRMAMLTAAVAGGSPAMFHVPSCSLVLLQSQQKQTSSRTWQCGGWEAMLSQCFHHWFACALMPLCRFGEHQWEA
jgi:hypothetical protein